MSYLALGTPIVFTERAAIARKGDDKVPMSYKGWFLPGKGNGEIPGALEMDAVKFVNGKNEPLSSDSLEMFNKAVVTWETTGSGVICGLETKQYGTSYPPSGGSNMYGEDDWEPGYFTSYGGVKLYVVRQQLEGRKYLHVPTWAARVMVWRDQLREAVG